MPALTVTISSDLALEFIHIPAGEFLMGSKESDCDAFYGEQPQHRLFLDNYWIGRYLVTNRQFETYTRLTGFSRPASKVQAAAIPNWAQCPAVDINWLEALAFGEWVGHQTTAQLPANWVVRLPTEAEWEKAARGSDGRIYPWGDEPPSDSLCNFDLHVGFPTPVSLYSPCGDSPYGCADMVGNVAEWTLSRWGKEWDRPDFLYPYHPRDGREDLAGDDYRVVRGGAFYGDQGIVRCAFRERLEPEGRSRDIGFRLAVGRHTGLT
jgi:serine/threonine-protein kinase